MLTLPLLLGLSSPSDAEYLIYLKGGHFIVVDDCTFSTSQGVRKAPGADKRSIVTEDCTKGKPKGQIFWSTINGNFGEVSADDVYAIFGTKSIPPIKPSSTTMPLEDYLIMNRGESFVNAKTVEEKGLEFHGRKRDEEIKVNRRGVVKIAPESLAISQSGQGLCSGEPTEFAVNEIELVEGHLLGAITNLSKNSWRPWIEVEVRVQGQFKGKFKVEDSNVLQPGDSISMDSAVDGDGRRLLKDLERLKDPEAGVRLCYRKVKTEGDKGTNR